VILDVHNLGHAARIGVRCYAGAEKLRDAAGDKRNAAVSVGPSWSGPGRGLGVGGAPSRSYGTEARREQERIGVCRGGRETGGGVGLGWCQDKKWELGWELAAQPRSAAASWAGGGVKLGQRSWRLGRQVEQKDGPGW
jgi:hypothetical protein